MPRPTIEYQPRGAALELFHCRDPEILIEGPSGTGKTLAILTKTYCLAMKYPGSRHLLLRQSRASMTESVLVTFERDVLRPEERSALTVSRQYRHAYDFFRNGSSIVVGGLDNPERVLSTDYDTATLFEATEASEDAWEKLQPRLRNNRMPYQQAFADCNPSYPAHWLNQRAASGAMTRLLSRHADNPSVTPEYLATLSRLTGARRARFFDGKWAAMEGLVYDVWDEARHVIPNFPIPEWWPRYRAIDFGFNEPFVCLWAAHDKNGERGPEGGLYVYRQLVRSKRRPDTLADEVRTLTGNEPIRQSWADHDASERALFGSRGISTSPAIKESRKGGIDAVDRWLSAHASRVGVVPKLYVFRDSLVERDPQCVADKRPIGIAEEMQGYVWQPAVDGRPAKDEPLGMHDHAMDSLRYLVQGVEQASEGLVSVSR